MKSEKQSVRLWRHLLRVAAPAPPDQLELRNRKDSLKIKELGHLRIEKASNLFKDMF
jgi:hypothetical protein